MASPRSVYLNWRRQPDIGCQFARFIAFKPGRHGQIVEVVNAKSTPAAIASSVDRRIARLIANPTVSAAVLVFPEVTTLEGLAKALLALKGRRGWQVSCAALTHPTAGELVTIAISRTIPFEGASMASEALVLGPFAEFPPTRRSPVVALEIYVGEPRKLDPKTQQPSKKANLAHMDLDLPGQGFQRMWDKSIAGRTRALGGQDDLRAKAKVALVIPKALADKLGVAP